MRNYYGYTSTMFMRQGAGVGDEYHTEQWNRVVCCCDYCQAFARQLESDTAILDDFGGTEIYQTSQSQIKINTGEQHLRCLRLSSKGLIRWYTDCCKTPIGNTVSAGFPFIGVIHSFIHIEGSRDNVLGPIRAYVQTNHANETPPYPNTFEKFPIGVTLRLMGKVFVWKIKGMNKPSAFFTQSGEAKVTPTFVK